MSQYERNLELLNKRRIVYRRDPITDIPDIENDMYMFFENGTYQCYDLFKSTAKITTYKSLKWHLLVLWYLNPGMDQDEYISGTDDSQNSLQDLINEIDLLRQYNIQMIKNLPDSKFVLSGIASGSSVTVRANIYIIAGHTAHHLDILKERYL